MDSEHTHYEIDERFVDDWVAFGLAEIESHLAKHARFAEYCAKRSTPADH
jgi:hypothetical protein